MSFIIPRKIGQPADPEGVDLSPFMADSWPGGADDDALNARAYRILREALLSGAYAPGALLSIRTIAAQIGMSPMPLREALARLRSEGGLETLPNRAFRVPVLAVETFREILLARIRLEALACERAATLITFEEIRRVSDLFEALTAEADGAPEAYLHLHRRFHFTIYETARMPVLSSVIEGLWLRIGPLIYASSRERMAMDRNHHGAIVRALRACDPTAAALALRDDIADGLEPVCAYLAARHAGKARHAL